MSGVGLQERLFVPTDVEAAHKVWQANCGPCAVAALLGLQVNAVRELFEPWPGYTNPTLIRRAVGRAGLSTASSSQETVQKGLGFVQFEGPWEKGGARAAYRHTHWVALARRRMVDADGPFGDPVLYVYDVAAASAMGEWIPVDLFDSRVVPIYLETERKATGWRFRKVFEVVGTVAAGGVE